MLLLALPFALLFAFFVVFFVALRVTVVVTVICVYLAFVLDMVLVGCCMLFCICGHCDGDVVVMWLCFMMFVIVGLFVCVCRLTLFCL